MGAIALRRASESILRLWAKFSICRLSLMFNLDQI